MHVCMFVCMCVFVCVSLQRLLILSKYELQFNLLETNFIL